MVAKTLVGWMIYRDTFARATARTGQRQRLERDQHHRSCGTIRRCRRHCAHATVVVAPTRTCAAAFMTLLLGFPFCGGTLLFRGRPTERRATTTSLRPAVCHWYPSNKSPWHQGQSPLGP